ncbi:hypothetical protein CRM22_006392 [Opisthorchis felineus]|uniref:Bardet-Biedl syndrome 2 protein homolog n=1 Tax=Opisthorchis felineus TaxID=147828 RepID=A0A4S2LL77_OPIFE|nr:hypothetical protein CRM22_006392 [Opisthorchis felineus]TGZ64404.1 hypothetical protein CRM22_006392 [Opisthorchis felineus]
MLFTQRLPFKIVPTLVTAGKFSRGDSSLAFVTPSGKLVIRWGAIDGNTSGDGENCQVCTVAPNLCSLTTGRFNSEADHDVLFYGSKSGVVAFDPVQNVEIFYNVSRDGANCIGVFSNLTSKDESLLVVGGNCSLVGFNRLGAEVLWTVTGDVVSSLTFIDAELSVEELAHDLVVGSENFCIRIIHKDAVQDEITETDVVTNLTSLGQGYFGYGLRNGTVGVYNRAIRVWRIKCKSKPVSLVAYDINQDGCLELICGWANGKVDARLRATGVVVFKTQLESPIAGLVVADYANFSDILLVCSVDGEVQGYAQCVSEPGVDSAATEELLRELNLRKQQAMLQLHHQTEGSRTEHIGSLDVPDDRLCKIQADTTLQFHMDHDAEARCVQLYVKSNNETPLRCMLLFGEGLFPECESRIIYPRESANFPSGYVVQLRPSRNLPVDLFIKGYAIPAMRSTEQSLFHVLSATVLLPRFSMYRLIDEEESFALAKPVGGVQFCLSDRPQRLIGWIQENFIVNEELRINKAGNLVVCFQALRPFSDPVPRNGVDGEEILSNLSAKASPVIWIRMSAKGEVTMQLDDIETASDMIQSIAKQFNLTNLSSTCNFPLAFAQLSHAIQAVEAHSVTREQIIADMAEKMEQMKVTLVKAEGHRLTCNWASAKEMYIDLLHANRQLLASFNSRSNEHQLLTDCQKRINQLIEQASSLRVGKYKTHVVALCREALQNQRVKKLFKIIRTGGE